MPLLAVHHDGTAEPGLAQLGDRVRCGESGTDYDDCLDHDQSLSRRGTAAKSQADLGMSAAILASGTSMCNRPSRQDIRAIRPALRTVAGACCPLSGWVSDCSTW